MSLNTNLFKTSNFRIQFKDSKNIEFRVTATSLPDLTLGVLSFGRPGVRDNRPGDSLEYGDLALTVLCDEDLLAYIEVYTSIINSSNPETAVIDPLNTVFDATLFLTTNKNNVQHQVLFKNAFFKYVGALDLSTTTNNEENITFPITLGYTHFQFI